MENENVKPAETETPASTEVKKNNNTSKKKKWLIIVGAIVIVFIGLVSIVNSATSGVVNVSNQMINAIQAQDADLAYSLMTAEAKSTITKEDFDGIISQIGPILNTEEKMLNKSVESGTGKTSSGQVTYSIKGTDGVDYTFEINLQKEGDNWKVLNFDSTK